MAADTLELVSACSVCACSKATYHAPVCLLHPLSILNCPWSHITVDFVTGLPSLEHNTTILTTVDRFSEAVHFVPLAKLPSFLETAHLLIVHVFRLLDTAQDIMSDQGPRFVSHVWRAFCQALGASASLSSGYHPQHNCLTEWANQDLESALCCVASCFPASWSTQLPWMAYAHNLLVGSATGMSLFMVINCFQPPLFPCQESQVLVPSIHLRLARGPSRFGADSCSQPMPGK